MLLLKVIMLLAILLLIVFIPNNNTIIKLTIDILHRVTMRSNVNIDKSSTETIYMINITISNMINDRTIIDSIIIKAIRIDTFHY